MKFQEIKDLTKAELKKKRDSIKEEIFTMRMKNSLGQMASPIQIRHMRRDYARVITALNRQSVR